MLMRTYGMIAKLSVGVEAHTDAGSVADLSRRGVGRGDLMAEPALRLFDLESQLIFIAQTHAVTCATCIQNCTGRSVRGGHAGTVSCYASRAARECEYAWTVAMFTAGM